MPLHNQSRGRTLQLSCTTNPVAGQKGHYELDTITANKDDADLRERAQSATVPNDGELTVSELVKFDIDCHDSPSPGTPFSGVTEWSYNRALDSGRVLEYGTKTEWPNIHYPKSSSIDIDRTPCRPGDLPAYEYQPNSPHHRCLLR